MRIKGLLLMVFVLSTFLGVSLLLTKTTPLKIITSKSVYSYINTSEQEGFRIPLLINKKEEYYTDTSYISSIQLHNETESIDLLINGFYTTDNIIVYDKEEFYEAFLDCRLAFYNPDYYISLEEAMLMITYDNLLVVDVLIGEFNYGFYDLQNNDFYLGNLIATYDDIDEVRTVSGVFIELYNNTGKNLYIKRFDVLSSAIGFNNRYITKTDEVDPFSRAIDIIGSEYDVLQKDIVENPTFVQANQSISVYIPLEYDEYSHIHRFPIAVSYLVDEELKRYYIDDFIFMSTSIFQPDYTEGFMVYEYSN